MMSLEWLSREWEQYLLYLHLQHNIQVSYVQTRESQLLCIPIYLPSSWEMNQRYMRIIPIYIPMYMVPASTKYSWGKTKSEYIDSYETSVSGFLTNYLHDRYASAPEQHISNINSSNHTSVWNREDTLVLTRPQTSVCEGEHSHIIIHSANEGDTAHATPLISSANPNIGQQDASSASTSSHHSIIPAQPYYT